MQAKEIKKDIYWVGVKDWNLREFHGYATPHGSTYNSYLIMDEKITLVDGVKSYMSQEMTERVKSVVDFSQISYVVVNHVEMDHSGNIPEIMKLAPQAVIITDNAGKMALEAHFDTAGWNHSDAALAGFDDDLCQRGKAAVVKRRFRPASGLRRAVCQRAAA